MTCYSAIPDAVAPSRFVRHGRLILDFTKGPDANTYLSHQHGSYPFHICRAQYLDATPRGMATLYMQSCSGGIFRGDDLAVQVSASQAAEAHLTTQASTIVHCTNGVTARQHVHLNIQDGSYLEYCPEPTILFPGAGFCNSVEIKMGSDSAVLLWESFLFHAPEHIPGTFDVLETTATVKDTCGKVLALDRMVVDGDTFLQADVGGMNGMSCLATVMFIAPDSDCLALMDQARIVVQRAPAAYAAVSQLPDRCGFWSRIIAPDPICMRSALAAVWHAIRLDRYRHAPAMRKK